MHTCVVIYFFNKKTPLFLTREFLKIVACSKIQTNKPLFFQQLSGTCTVWCVDSYKVRANCIAAHIKC